MNYVFISPNFPDNFKRFILKLSEEGINVLGIGDAQFDSLDKDLASAMGEYYRVDDMEDYAQVFKACAHFSFKHGKIDRLESHNEHWLEQDARLREDFNIFGSKSKETSELKQKIKMKEVFKNLGLPIIRGEISNNYEAAAKFVEKVGFPVVVKPNIGVGAASTYRISNYDELKEYYDELRNYDTIIEEYIDGHIETFDGLLNTEGEIVLQSSFLMSEGIMDAVINRLDMKFYIQKELFPELESMGRKILSGYNLKERFFHIEFFRKPSGTLIPLEINCRAPGGPVLDLMSIAFDFDIYELYAKIVSGQDIKRLESAKYYCGYAGIHHGDGISHVNSKEDILEKYGDIIIENRENPDVFAGAMGKDFYVLKTKDLDILNEVIEYIVERN